MASPSDHQRCVVDDSENNRSANENKSFCSINENSSADQSANDEMAMDTVNIDNVCAEVVIDDATNASTANIDAIIKSTVAVVIVPEELHSDGQSSSISLAQVTDKMNNKVVSEGALKSVDKPTHNVKPIMTTTARSVGSDDAVILTCGHKGE